MPATARPPCSRHSMSSTAPCPAAACGGTAIGSASTSTPRWWRGYSLADPQAVSHRCLAEHNASPKPLICTATPKKIMAMLEPLNASAP